MNYGDGNEVCVGDVVEPRNVQESEYLIWRFQRHLASLSNVVVAIYKGYVRLGRAPCLPHRLKLVCRASDADAPERRRQACWPSTGEVARVLGNVYADSPENTACSADELWATDLPPGRPIRYVLAGAPLGGKGTRESPFGTITEALTGAASGTVVALSKGVFNEEVVIPPGVTLWGVGVEETRVAVVWGAVRSGRGWRGRRGTDARCTGSPAQTWEQHLESEKRVACLMSEHEAMIQTAVKELDRPIPTPPETRTLLAMDLAGNPWNRTPW